MCKLTGWTSAPNTPLLKSHANAGLVAAHAVIKRTEKDGFGFAQAGSKGLRSRYAEPTDFRELDGLTELFKRAGGAAKAFAFSSRSHHAGTYAAGSHMIAHGRTATCAVTLDNVHPFRRRGWTLAHNGVVDWEGPAAGDQPCPHSQVTCDSQHLLIAMADHKTTAERKEALSHISGYAAFLALSPRGELIAAVDDTARLFAGITSKGRWIFGTTAEIVEAVAGAWKSKGVTAYQLDAHTWLEFKAAGGDPDLSEWKHKASTGRQMGYASRSLGAGWEGRKRKGGRSVTSYGSGTYGAGAWASGIHAAGGRFLSAAEAEEAAGLMTEQDAIEAVQAAEAADTAAACGVPDWEGPAY